MNNFSRQYLAIYLPLAILAFFSVAISVIFFYSESLRLDEVQSLWQTSQSMPKIIELTSNNVHVPGYHLLLHLWQFFVGSNMVAGRLLSTIFFVLSIPALYLLARALYKNEKIALFASALFALSPFMLWYASEIRMYTLFAFITIVHQYLFLRLFRKKEDWTWILFGFLSLLSMFVHYFFFLVLLTEAIFYFNYRKSFPKGSIKRFLIIIGMMVVAFAPWATLVLLSDFSDNSSPSLSLPSSVDIFNVYTQFLFGFQGEWLNSLLLAFWPLAILLAFMILGRFRQFSEETVFLLLFIFVPVITAFGLSFIQPLFLTRYLTLAAPSLFIFVAWLISLYPPKMATIMRYSLIALMLLTLTIQINAEDIPVKEPFREIAEYLEKEATFRDVIIVSAPFNVYPMEYFYDGPAVLKTLPIWDRYVEGPVPNYNPDTIRAEVDQVRANHERLFLVLAYDQGYEEDLQKHFDSRFHKLESIQFSSEFEVRVYRVGYASDYFKNKLINPPFINGSTGTSTQNTLIIPATTSAATSSVSTSTSATSTE